MLISKQKDATVSKSANSSILCTDRGKAWAIFCPQSFFSKQNKMLPLQIPTCLAAVLTLCVFVSPIFSYRGTDVLGLAGKKVLGHCQAGECKTKALMSNLWDV